MLVTFRNDPAGRTTILLRRADGVVVGLPSYDRAGRVPHDLAHFSAERALGLPGGLFGSIAGGGMFAGMTVVEGTPRHDAVERSRRLLAGNKGDLGLAELMADVVARAVPDEAAQRARPDARRDPTATRRGPTEAEWTPTAARRDPTEAEWTPTDTRRASTDAGWSPTDTRRAPTDAGWTPTDTRRAPTDARWTPTDLGPAPAKARRAPADARRVWAAFRTDPYPWEDDQVIGAVADLAALTRAYRRAGTVQVIWPDALSNPVPRRPAGVKRGRRGRVK